MNRSQALKKVQSINNLPTLPAIALEVNRLLQDFDTPIDALMEILEKDQTLVMKILKLVNSSFYGFKSKVNSLRHAVTLMGYNMIRNAVVTVAVMDTLALKQELKGFEIDKFWKHAIQVAVMSRFLALRTRLVSGEDAFTGGLLHDVGKIVQVNYFTPELMDILATMDQDELTFDQAESKLGFCDHGSTGSYLAQRWLLPESLIETIRYHHRSPALRDGGAMLPLLVGLANNLVHMMAADPGYHLILGDSPQRVKDIAVVIVNDGGKCLCEIKNNMDAACSFFSKG